LPYAEVNGVNLYYNVYGEGEPIVFIHGIAITSKVWDFQKNYIPRYYRMIVYDLRGSGKSQKTTYANHSCELLAEDLKGLIDYLKLDKVNIVGLSMGASVAMRFAAQYPSAVKNLIITGAVTDLHGTLAFICKHFSGIIGRTLMTKVGGVAATKIMLPSCPRDDIMYYHSEIISIDEDEVIKYYQILKSHRITGALNRIICPTLILYGSLEPVFHRYGRQIKEKIRNSKMMIVPGVGHGWNGENPELFSSIIMEFIQENS
jgi:3-oxoadipate enol-lactonase